MKRKLVLVALVVLGLAAQTGSSLAANHPGPGNGWAKGGSPVKGFSDGPR